jgi:non-ribosomal peptide synthetase component F
MAEAPERSGKPTEWAFPASFAQERVWIAASQREPGSPLYTLVGLVPLELPVEPPDVEAALAEVVGRHEALRTDFRVEEGALAQVVHASVPVRVRRVDLQALAPAEREQRLAELHAELGRAPLPLDRAPLWRAVLARFEATRWGLLFAAHHAVFDGASYVNLWTELTELCRSAVEHRPARLPELPIQYPDYAVWQRDQLSGERLQRRLDFWRARMAGLPPVHALPTDRPRPATPGGAGGEVRFRLPAEVVDGVEELARRRGATPFMVLLAAYVALIARLSGQADVVVGVPVAGRDLPELAPLIGMFVNPFVLRVAVPDPVASSFADLLGSVRAAVLEAWDHRDTPFQLVVAAGAPRRDRGVPPLYQLGFNYTPEFGTDDAHGASEDDLMLDLGLREGRLEYATELFDAATARALADRYLRVLGAAVARPETRLRELDLLSPGERALVLERWNSTAADLPDRAVVHELVWAQVSRTPEATAVVAGDRRLSYTELRGAAGRLAARLREAGVGPGSLVGVCLRRTPELLVALLGVLEAGGAYVPLDPEYPRARLGYTLADAGAAVLLTERPLLTTLPGAHGATTLLLDDPEPGAARPPSPGHPAEPGPGDLAYVIYTSGSTGRPKGVEIEHGALVNLLLSMRDLLGAAGSEGLERQARAGAPGREATPSHRPVSGEPDAWLALTSLSFDISALELYLPLLAGGRVVLAPDGAGRDGQALERLISEQGVTHVQATPSGWRPLLDAGFELPGVTALVGGEALPPPLARELRARVGWLGNLYGPTETTVWSTLWPVPRAVGAVAIGRPIANTRVYVLDERLEPLPVGVPGQLYIGGAGVARGYHHRPALTAERFVPDPYGPAGGRLYATGDRARWRADGQLEFLGRADNQVKLRGHRVELGEIEARLLEHPAVAEAAVIGHGDGDDHRLVAYLVCRTAAPPATGELRRHLAGTLPAYMLPSAFVGMDRLPLTPGGKLDRRALPPLERAAGGDRAHVAPRGAGEELVAAAFAEVLGLGRVGATDDFFDLGGHSLLAIRAISRLSAAVGAEVPIHALFAHSTVAELAAEVETLLLAEIDQLSDDEAERLLADDWR